MIQGRERLCPLDKVDGLNGVRDLFEVPDFHGGHVEVSGGGERVVVEGPAGLAPAEVETLVEKDRELAVVDSDADGLRTAEDEQAVLAGPLPDLQVPVAVGVSGTAEDESLAAAKRLVADLEGLGDESAESVAFHVPDEQDGGSVSVVLLFE